VQYAFLITLYGVLLSLMGWRAFRIILVPLLILIFMIPLPNFLYNNLSAQLQLVSSQLGVWIIRLFGISVFLEGNVIDLGSMKLQVVEACSGLRYLFPLMTIAFIAAYMFKGAFWKRAVIFLSSIPITVFMNSVRIGVIGILVEFRGESMAQGFLHDFEGWAVFMVCTAVLVLEMWVLARIGKEKRALREVFGLEMPAPVPKEAQVQYRPIPRTFAASLVVLIGAAVLATALPERGEAHVPRQAFSEFPMAVGPWQGQHDRLEQIYIDTLKFDDYIIADYADDETGLVNLYVAYYDSQRKGQSAHSPRSCIPGGGWEIVSLTQRRIDGVEVDGEPLRVNRTEIQYGDQKQLVYYWFQQRGRVIDNEYLVKWYLFWDALTRNRTDGALVRLTSVVRPGEDVDEADRRLSAWPRCWRGISRTSWLPSSEWGGRSRSFFTLSLALPRRGGGDEMHSLSWHGGDGMLSLSRRRGPQALVLRGRSNAAT
jgi:exosortase D (VPLPA-CTERM-specific)